MNSGQQEEHLFLVELGEVELRLLYLLYVNDEEVPRCAAGFSRPSEGVESGMPSNPDLLGSLLQSMIEECEAKYEIKVQTLIFCIKGFPFEMHSVDQIESWSKYFDSAFVGKSNKSHALSSALPVHREALDFVRFKDESFLMLIPSTVHQSLESTVYRAGIFLERVLCYPALKIEVGSRQSVQLLLGLFEDYSGLIIFEKGEAVHYQAIDFSLKKIAKELCRLLGIDFKMALEVLDIVAASPANEKDRWEDKMDHHLLLGRHLGKVKELLADALEQVAVEIDDLLEAKQIETDSESRLWLLGKASRHYERFSFLRDFLPIVPEPLLKESDLPQGLSSEFGFLWQERGRALSQRRRNRAWVKGKSGDSPLRMIARRIFGQ